MADSKESRPNNLGGKTRHKIAGVNFEKTPIELKIIPSSTFEMTLGAEDEVTIIHVGNNSVDRGSDGTITRIDEKGNVLTGNKEKENIEK